MSTEQDPYEEGKRAGLHPLIVLFGAILVMWLLINLAVPSGKQKQAAGPEISQVTTEDPDAAPVMYKVQSTLTEFNAVSIVVPAQATTSQVVGLLKQFKQARLAQTPNMQLRKRSAPWLAAPTPRATSTRRPSPSKKRWNTSLGTIAST